MRSSIERLKKVLQDFFFGAAYLDFEQAARGEKLARLDLDFGKKIHHGIVHHCTSHSGIGFKPSGGSFDWPIQFGGFIE